VEIWNDVFMEYNKKVKDEKQIEYKLLKERKEKIPDDFFEYVKLSQRNVDTGMGLERVLAVMNGQDDNYRTELFWPLIEKIEELSGKQYNSPQPPLILREGDEITRAMRIIADHLRTATFILAEGIEPSNLKQGYVLRKLIRRAVRYSKPLSIDSIFTSEIARVVIKIYTDVYPELQKNKEFIVNQLIKEEEKFRSVLEAGLKKIQRLIEKKEKEMEGALLVEDRGQVIPPSEFLINVVSPKEAFDLYQNDGFPLEMINEELAKHGLSIDTKEFNEEFKRHQELSRTASVGMFKGGLADAGEQAARLHTATHLLQAALRKVLGEHVAQKGSNITAERLRFDFSHDKKMTSEEIKEVEDLVNEQIKKDIPVEMKEMTAEEAKKEGALGVFESKYDERVKVYSVNEFSKEICGGPHAKRTGELGKFGVVKEEASSAGVRRIKAVLE
jgi:alanyl-tRNA synthetase